MCMNMVGIYMLLLERVGADFERVLLAGWDVAVVVVLFMGIGNVGREVQQRGRFIGKRMLRAKEDGL